MALVFDAFFGIKFTRKLAPDSQLICDDVKASTADPAEVELLSGIVEQLRPI